MMINIFKKSQIKLLFPIFLVFIVFGILFFSGEVSSAQDYTPIISKSFESHTSSDHKICVNTTLDKYGNYTHYINLTTNSGIFGFKNYIEVWEDSYESIYNTFERDLNCNSGFISIENDLLNGTILNENIYSCDSINYFCKYLSKNSKKCYYDSTEVIGTNPIKVKKIYNYGYEIEDLEVNKKRFKQTPFKEIKKDETITYCVEFKTKIENLGNKWGSYGSWKINPDDDWVTGYKKRKAINITNNVEDTMYANFTFGLKGIKDLIIAGEMENNSNAFAISCGGVEMNVNVTSGDGGNFTLDNFTVYAKPTNFDISSFGENYTACYLLYDNITTVTPARDSSQDNVYLWLQDFTSDTTVYDQWMNNTYTIGANIQKVWINATGLGIGLQTSAENQRYVMNVTNGYENIEMKYTQLLSATGGGVNGIAFLGNMTSPKSGNFYVYDGTNTYMRNRTDSSTGALSVGSPGISPNWWRFKLKINGTAINWTYNKTTFKEDSQIIFEPQKSNYESEGNNVTGFYSALTNSRYTYYRDLRIQRKYDIAPTVTLLETESLNTHTPYFDNITTYPDVTADNMLNASLELNLSYTPMDFDTGNLLNGTIKLIDIDSNYIYFTTYINNTINGTQVYSPVNFSRFSNSTLSYAEIIGHNFTFLVELNDGAYTNTTNSTYFSIVNTLPEGSGLYLNSTLGPNDINNNLTINWTSIDYDGFQSIKNITNWWINNETFEILNLPFEGGSNTTYTRDYSGYETKAIVQNNSIWCPNCGYDGYGAYLINGSYKQYINLTTTYTFGDADNWTITSWIFIGGLNEYSAIFGDHTSNSWVAIYDVVGESSIDYRYRDDYSTIVTLNTDNPVSNQWNFYAFMCNKSGFSVYENNLYKGTVTGATCRYDLDNIGKAYPNSYYFNGTIDDLRVYNGSLSAEQIDLLWNNRTDMISSNELSEGDIWHTNLTVNDGWLDSTTIGSNYLKINTNPIMEISINYTQELYTTTDLNCTGNYSDIDGDSGNVLLWVYKNDLFFNQTNFTVTNGANFSHLITNKSYNAGDKIVCQFHANDTLYENNDYHNTSIITILGSKLTGFNSSIYQNDTSHNLTKTGFFEVRSLNVLSYITGVWKWFIDSVGVINSLIVTFGKLEDGTLYTINETGNFTDTNLRDYVGSNLTGILELTDEDNVSIQFNSTTLLINNSAPNGVGFLGYDSLGAYNDSIGGFAFVSANGIFLRTIDSITDYQMISIMQIEDSDNDTFECNFTITSPNNTQPIINKNGTKAYISTGKYWYQSDIWNNTMYGEWNVTINCTDSFSSYYDNFTYNVFSNSSVFTTKIKSNRSDSQVGFGSNITITSYIQNGSNDEIYDVNMSLFLPSGGRLFADNNSINYKEYYWNSSFSTYLNETGEWIAEVCYKNVWGLHECQNDSIIVEDRTFLLPTKWTFAPTTEENIIYNNLTISHGSPESFNFSFNWTDDVVLNNSLFNSTIFYNSFIVNSNQERSNYLILNISESILKSNWTDNILIERVSHIPGVNKTYIIPVFIGIDRPTGIPTAYDEFGTDCTVAGNCDLIRNIPTDYDNVITKEWYVGNTGGTDIENCYPYFVWANGSKTTNPIITCSHSETDFVETLKNNRGSCYEDASGNTRFTNDKGEYVKITARFTEQLSAGNYTGEFETECVASLNNIYNRTFKHAGSPDGHPRVRIIVAGQSAIGTSSTSSVSGGVIEIITQPLGGFCESDSDCFTNICDLFEDSARFQSCVNAELLCGNGACDFGKEDVANCPTDCGLSTLEKVPLYIKVGALIIASSFIYIWFYSGIVKKKKKRKK